MKSYLLGVIGVLLTWTAVLADSQPTEEEPLPSGALQRIGSTHLRHGSGILASDLSPDGKLLATMSDRSVVIWDLATERRVKQLETQGSYRWFGAEIRFSPDGRWLACLRPSRSARLWELSTNRVALDFSGNAEEIPTDICFTSDSTEFRAVVRPKVLSYDLASGRPINSWERPNARLLSPEGQYYLQESDDEKSIILRDLKLDKELWRTSFKRQEFDIGYEGRIAMEGKLIALLEPNKGIEIRELATGKSRASLEIPKELIPERREMMALPGYLRLACSNNRIFLIGRHNHILQWDEMSGPQQVSLDPKALVGSIRGIHKLPTDKQILTTGRDGIIRRWNTQNGEAIAHPRAFAGDILAAVSKDGRRLAISDKAGRLVLWKNLLQPQMTVLKMRETGRLDGSYSAFVRRSLPFELPAEAIVFSPDSKQLVVLTMHGSIDLWSLDSEQPRELQMWGKRERFDGEVDSMRNLIQISPDGRLLAVMMDKKPLWLVEISSNQVRWSSSDSHAIFSSDGKLLAGIMGQFNKPQALRLLDASNGQVVRTFALELPFAIGPPVMSFTPDDRELVVGSQDKLIFLEVKSGLQARQFTMAELLANASKERAEVTSMAFSPDGNWLLSGGTDGIVRLCEVTTRKELIHFDAHEADVHTVAFGPHGRAVISAANDGLAYLWDLRPKAPQTKAALDELWQQLASDDARLAYRATWAIQDQQAKEASVFLRNKISPVRPVEKAQLLRLIKDLDSPRFQEREAATRTLAQIGDLAAPALEEALAKSPPLEMRQRLQKLLDQMRQGMSPDELRTTRAVQAMALAGTPEALETLRTWAKGAPEARLTRLAKSAVQRLDPSSSAK